MSPRAKKATKEDMAKPWTEVHGRHPHNVQIVERRERDLEIQLRYKDPAKVKAGVRDARTWKATGLRARSALGRKWDDAVRAEARRQAAELELTLRADKSPAPGTEQAASGAATTAAAAHAAATAAPLSISEGIALATVLDGTGMLSAPVNAAGVRTPDRVTKEIISRSKTFVRIWTAFERKNEQAGKRMPTWDSFTPVHADYVVRTLAEEHVKSGSHGFTVAMKMLDEFYRMARWLKEQRKIAHDACVPRDKWKVAARKEWEKNAGKLAKRQRLRHSEPEMRAIFSALDDPRGRLSMLLSYGARLSLFVDRRWSHLRLERTQQRPHGGIAVEEGPANVYVRRLNARQRELLDEALATGYLRRYEAARLTGDLVDYPILPEGRLVLLPDESADRAPALVPSAGAPSLSVDGPNVLTIDPRNRLAVELGAALRLGQVYRTWRTQVDMEAFHFIPAGEEAAPAAVGIVDVQGRGNKQSPGLALNVITRQALEDAFEGYLSELEALYLAGAIENYPLFPAGRLINGIANPEGKYTQMEVTRDAALGWFHELETIAGVENKRGRGWNGLRRIYTDEAPKYTSNEKTLNTVSGTSTEMRTQVYQDQASLEAKIDAARVTAAIRTGGRVAGATPAPNPLLVEPALAKALSVYSPNELRAAIAHLEAQRAAAAVAADSDDALDADGVRNGALVDPTVDPNAEARVHDRDPGLISAASTTTS